MSSDNSSSPAPNPLRDRTNSAAVTASDLDEKDREIERLKLLLQGYTKKKRGRGRRRLERASDEEQNPTPAKKAKVVKATDYVTYGRTISRFLGPFVNYTDIVTHGTAVDGAMSDDENEIVHKPKVLDAWKILWSKFPGFHEYLLKLSNDPDLQRAIIQQLTAGAEAARQEDTASLKPRVPGFLYQDPSTPLDPPLADVKVKALRGMAHPVFAWLLTPMEWEAIQSIWLEITEGKRHLKGSQLPRFVFPLGQIFPIDKPLDDPEWDAVLDNALKGEVLIRSAKVLLMGPEAALKGDGFSSGRPGKASIITMTTFTPRAISNVATQVYFALSSKQEWGRTDGQFNYEEFFWTICGLFDDVEWGKKIINIWNKSVLGIDAEPEADAGVAVGGPSALEQLKAARAARFASASTAPDAPPLP